MKRVLKVFIFISVFIAVIAFTLSIYLDGFYWEKKSSSTSPDGSLIAYEYYNMSDSDKHAPYGTYLFLQSSYKPMPAYKGYVIFAGYCNNKFKYSWASNKQLNIVCSSNEIDSIRSYSKKAYGVNISVSSKNS